MFGFLPPNVDDSLTSLIIYNAFPVEVKFNANGAIKSTWTSVSHNGANFVKYIFILGIYSSAKRAYDHQPYPNNEGANLLDINILTGFSRQQLINNTLTASKYSDLLFFFAGTRLILYVQLSRPPHSTKLSNTFSLFSTSADYFWFWDKHVHLLVWCTTTSFDVKPNI